MTAPSLTGASPTQAAASTRVSQSVAMPLSPANPAPSTTVPWMWGLLLFGPWNPPAPTPCSLTGRVTTRFS